MDDRALGWFSALDFSDVTEKLDADWVVMASPDIRITREFLDSAADICAEFPFADAIAPRIVDSGGTVFSSGFLLHAKDGLREEFLSNEKAEIRQVASLSPRCGIYSSRLLKSLRSFDDDFRTDIRFFDMGLRALHLGAHLFAMPNLHAESCSPALPEKFSQGRLREIARAYYKDFDILRYFRFAARHPKVLFSFFKGKPELDRKSLAATELSKLTPETLVNVSCRK